MTTTTEPIEIWEEHPVTASAISVNIGSGLKEAQRVNSQLFRSGQIVDIVTRVKFIDVTHKPLGKVDGEPDTDGDYVRVMVGKPLAAVVVETDVKGASTVSKIIDQHLAAVAAAKAHAAKQQEIDGQQALLDEEERLTTAEGIDE